MYRAPGKVDGFGGGGGGRGVLWIIQRYFFLFLNENIWCDILLEL